MTEFIGPILVPTAFYEEGDIDLQTMIYLENGIVYYNDADLNTDEFKLIKKGAVLKSE